MNKIIPFFEINGKRYEINRTRYLIAEYDKIGEQANISKEDKLNAIKIQNLITDIQKFGNIMQTLEDKYFETFDEEDERKYLRAKALYDNACNEYARLEVENQSTSKLQKISIDLLEKIAIKGLAEQYFKMNEDEGKKLWEAFVDKIGQKSAVEWLMAMSEYLFQEEDEVEDNSFLSQVRIMKQERANNRKNIKRK